VNAIEMRQATGVSWRLLPAALVSASAVLLFGVGADHDVVPRLAGYLLLVAGVGSAFAIDRELAADLGLIAIGMGIISAIRLEADISYLNMVVMGTVLALAVVVPYLLSRYVVNRRSGTQPIVFPILTGRRWSRVQWLYLIVVVVLGWLILPTYFIRSGAYLNWPAVTAPDELARLFVGVNAVGIWDELFFICTVFALLRKHFPLWQANILQATIFVSFLWELGYQSWGPLLTIPFALLQGYIFMLSKSLSYVVAVHLLFDVVVFLVIVHAHNPGALPIFWY
jgi:membrane protease YdiL (CAAX protease family)